MFPLLKENWTEADLNFTKLLNEVKLEYVTNMRVNFCPHPVTGDDIVCIYPVLRHTWERVIRTSENFTAQDIRDMLKILNIPADDADEMVRGFWESALKVKF